LGDRRDPRRAMNSQSKGVIAGYFSEKPLKGTSSSSICPTISGRGRGVLSRRANRCAKFQRGYRLRAFSPSKSRQKTNFVSPFNLIAPVKIGCENISLFPKCKSVVLFAHPVPSRRGVRVVTNVGAGGDGRHGITRRVMSGRSAKSCGPDPPMLWIKFRGRSLRSNGGYQARTPGRSRISRKTIAQGRPGRSG
jgi:hypothetical protein